MHWLAAFGQPSSRASSSLLMTSDTLDSAHILDELVGMSRAIGAPEQDCALLGEGNSSARVDDETFFVKASGACLATADANGFVRVRCDAVLDLLHTEGLDDAEMTRRLEAARFDAAATRRPSVETTFHAVLLSQPGVRFIGHSHPTPVNALLCSKGAPNLFAGRLFPDEIVCCGPEPVWVPYTDPGAPLALAIQERVEAYRDRWGTPPRVILMQNHGLIALGGTPAEVLSATFMMVKTARVLLGSLAAGGPRFMSEASVSRIHKRPDEHYRQKVLRGEA